MQPPTCISHGHHQEEKAARLHTYVSPASKKISLSALCFMLSVLFPFSIPAEHSESPGAPEPQPSTAAVAISQGTCGFPSVSPVAWC